MRPPLSFLLCAEEALNKPVCFVFAAHESVLLWLSTSFCLCVLI